MPFGEVIYQFYFIVATSRLVNRSLGSDPQSRPMNDSTPPPVISANISKDLAARLGPVDGSLVYYLDFILNNLNHTKLSVLISNYVLCEL